MQREQVSSAPAREADPELRARLNSIVCQETYRAATGPDGKGYQFTSTQVKAAFVYITFCIEVVMLYPEQILCLLSLFVGSHVFCLLATGFGKTFAYECLPLFYDFLYNGDHRLPSYRRVFYPVLFVINPLCSLMLEQTAAFNRMATKAGLSYRAANLSSEQKEPERTRIFTRVAQRQSLLALIHTSIETLLDPKKPFRDSLMR